MDLLEERLLLSAYVFNDVFNGAIGSGPGSAWAAMNSTDPNNGAVYYTNTLPANATPSNPATMGIVSDPTAQGGEALAMSLMPNPNGNGTYDSAEICTEFDPSGQGDNLLYGHIQASIRIPGGNNSGAIWPAFWMLGDDISTVSWPACGEIDIMENDGSQPGTIDSTLHGPASGGGDYNGGDGVGASYTLANNADFYSTYHIFAVDWGPNSVTFSVDGNPFYTLTPANLPSGATWPFNGHPFFIILDVCEGGDFAPGTITSKQTMYVNYVDASAYSLTAAAPLTDQDIGSSSPSGSASFDGVTNTLNGGGTGIGGTSDEFNFDSQLLSGNVTLITEVDWVGDTGQYAQGGLMIRNGLAANAGYALIQLNPANAGSSGNGGATFQYRSAAGSTTVTAGTDSSANLANGPIWLELVRVGNVFSAYDSTNGTSWKQVGSSETITMSTAAQVGLADDADNSSSLSTDTFSNVSILPGSFSNTNIGAPARFGTAGFTNSSSTWNVGAGGAGITGTADQFNFASQSLTGNGSIIADVQSMTSSTSLAAAGIMFRNDTTTSAAFAMLAETTAGGLIFEWRSSAGATAQSVSLAGADAPWIKLLRTGNSFSAYYSTNDTNWSQIGTAQTVTIASTALVGAAVTAGDNGGQLNVADFSLLSAANAASHLVYQTAPANTIAGDPFPGAITVAVEDSNGNLVESDDSTVTISVASGTATLQGTFTATAQNGVATFSNLAAASPGTATLVASDGVLTNATSSLITIANPPGLSPGAGAAYSITGYPGTETLDVSAGTVTLTSDQSANFASIGLRIESNASVVLQSVQHLGSLLLNGSAVLDVTRYNLFLSYASGNDPISSVTGWIASGCAGGAWNGTGIVSSIAAGNSNYGVGFADGAANIDPSLTHGEIEVAYAQYGDISLQGLVNAADFLILASNFSFVTTLGWEAGDFLYQGAVNAEDFNLLAGNFGLTETGEDAAQTQSAASTSAPASDSVSTQAPESTTTLQPAPAIPSKATRNAGKNAETPPSSNAVAAVSASAINSANLDSKESEPDSKFLAGR